jgi:predicted RecB family nuclease
LGRKRQIFTNKGCLCQTKKEEGLELIPGIGLSIETDLIDLGIRSASDLKGKKPQQMYDELCLLRGEHIDRCVLYVFREAVYFASGKTIIRKS